MQDDNLTRLLYRFATTAKAHHQALEDMNEERANTYAKMIAGMYRSIIGIEEGGRQALLALVDDNDPVWPEWRLFIRSATIANAACPAWNVWHWNRVCWGLVLGWRLSAGRAESGWAQKSTRKKRKGETQLIS